MAGLTSPLLLPRGPPGHHNSHIQDKLGVEAAERDTLGTQ